MIRFVIRICVCMIVSVLLVAGDADARKAVERPVKTAEISDPAERGDIRLLLFFELPSEVLNSNAIVDFALLKCEAEISGSFAGQIEIFPVTTSWHDRSDVSWNDPWENSGGDYSEEYLTSNFMLKSDIGKRGISIDVTEMVRDWQSGKISNKGIIIKVACDGLAEDRIAYQVDQGDIELVIHYSARMQAQE